MLVGLLALVALVALVAGVPAMLLTLFGSPIPDGVPDLSATITPGTFFKIVTSLLWLAWLQLIFTLVVEIWAAVRGVGVPARSRRGLVGQVIVRKLVVALMGLFTATAAVTSGFGQGSLSWRPEVSVTAMDGQDALAASASSAFRPVSTVEDAGETTKIYAVRPSYGRHHESLWEIAEKCLGDGRRYKEIFELNKGHVQSDGSRLHTASLIRPGWILEMPADALYSQIIPRSELSSYLQGLSRIEQPQSGTQPEEGVVDTDAALLNALNDPHAPAATRRLVRGLEELFDRLGPPPPDLSGIPAGGPRTQGGGETDA